MEKVSVGLLFNCWLNVAVVRDLVQYVICCFVRGPVDGKLWMDLLSLFCRYAYMCPTGACVFYFSSVYAALDAHQFIVPKSAMLGGRFR